MANAIKHKQMCCFKMYMVIFPVLFDYVIDGKVISNTDQHSYLGITLHKSMQWSHHIDIVCNKASKALNFIRRNLSKCSTEEYTACVWDPYQKYLTNNIEKIRRWVANGFCRTTINNLV